MSYFKHLEKVLYKIKSGDKPFLISNLSSFTDIVQGVKNNISMYETYEIQSDERPDNVAYNIYGDSDLHFILYLMNDDIRKNGWPLSYQELIAHTKKKYSGVILTTTSDISSEFVVGTVVVGQISGAVGTVLSKNQNLGQVNVSVTSGTFVSEAVEDQMHSSKNFVCVGATSAINGIHHYEDSNGDHNDINPYTQSTGVLNPITNLEYEVKINDTRSRINVLQPKYIDKILAGFGQ